MANDEFHPLALRTHTSLWQIERKMYRLFDWNLPRPVSLRALGFSIIGFSVWIPLMIVLPVPVEPSLVVLWVAPPVLFVWYANKPLSEGKNLVELGWSLFSYYVLQPKEFERLRASSEADTIYVTGKAYVNRAPVDAG